MKPTNKKMMEQTDDQPFKIRAYSKVELAALYNPNECIAVALQTLYRWMKGNPALMEDLERLHYNKFRRVFTPREVERIVYYLGEP
jgi:hypothetical protein